MTGRIPFPEGSGIFETLRTENGLVAEFARHMRRAVKSARELRIPIPSEDVVRQQVSDVLARQPFTVGRLRICFSLNGMSITHSDYLDATDGAFLTFSPHTSKALGEQRKEFPYDSHFEIVDEAKSQGFDDAMIFNSRNNLTETALSNIALYLDQEWVTPPIGAGLLPGVMRAISIERCGVVVREIHISEVAHVTAAVLLNSLKIAQPVEQIGEMRLTEMDRALQLCDEIRRNVQFFSVG